MDKIPLEEQRVIDELVEFWQTRYEPRDLITHLDRLSGSWGSGIGASFFRQVYEDLRTDKRSMYDASSAYEFKQFLEAEYHQQAKAEAERQAQVKAENERRARADFDALGKEMAKATTRAELVELGRKRADLARYTGVLYIYERHCKICSVGISSALNPRCPDCKGYICLNCDCCFCEPGKHVYENVCWNCHLEISSETIERCSVCGWYICSNCGSCSRDCDRIYNPVQVKAVDPFLPDYPDDIL